MSGRPPVVYEAERTVFRTFEREWDRMSTTLDEIRQKVLSLPEGDRVDLLNALADSIHEDPGLSDAWLEEIHRRRDQIHRGEAVLVEEDEMFARIEARRK